MPYPNLRVYIDPTLLTEARRQAKAEGKELGVYVGELIALDVGAVDAAAIANLMAMGPGVLADLDDGEGGLI
jgi:hypothetical protein